MPHSLSPSSLPPSSPPPPPPTPSPSALTRTPSTGPPHLPHLRLHQCLTRAIKEIARCLICAIRRGGSVIAARLLPLSPNAPLPFSLLPSSFLSSPSTSNPFAAPLRPTLPRPAHLAYLISSSIGAPMEQEMREVRWASRGRAEGGSGVELGLDEEGGSVGGEGVGGGGGGEEGRKEEGEREEGEQGVGGKGEESPSHVSVDHLHCTYFGSLICSTTAKLSCSATDSLNPIYIYIYRVK